MGFSRKFRRLIGARRGSSGSVSNLRIYFVLGVCAIVSGGVLWYVHTEIIPIPILFSAFFEFDADFKTFRDNLKRGGSGDLRDEFKKWSGGEAHHYTFWKNELLYNSGYYFAIAGGIAVTLGAFAFLLLGGLGGKGKNINLRNLAGKQRHGGARGSHGPRGAMGPSVTGHSGGRNPRVGGPGSGKTVSNRTMVQGGGNSASGTHRSLHGKSGANFRTTVKQKQRRLPTKLPPPPHYR